MHAATGAGPAAGTRTDPVRVTWAVGTDLHRPECSFLVAHRGEYSVGKSAFGSFASIAFGGPDRRTAHIGSFMANSLRLLLAGVAPVHWDYVSPPGTSPR